MKTKHIHHNKAKTKTKNKTKIRHKSGTYIPTRNDIICYMLANSDNTTVQYETSGEAIGYATSYIQRVYGPPNIEVNPGPNGSFYVYGHVPYEPSNPKNHGVSVYAVRALRCNLGSIPLVKRNDSGQIVQYCLIGT